MTKVLRYPLFILNGEPVRVKHIVGGAIGLLMIMAMFTVAAGIEDFAIEVFS